MADRNAKKTTKKAGTKPAWRRIVKRSAPDMAALLQAADDMDLKLYAAEGLTNFKERALASVERINEAGGTFDKFQDSDWILMLQYFRDKGKDDPVAESIIQGRGFGPDEIFAGIDSFVHNIALDDPQLKRLYEASEAKHKAAGFGEDEEWPEDDRPADVQEIFDAYWDRYHQLKVAILRHHGEIEMADLLENDPDDYDARVESGKAIFNEKHKDEAPGKNRADRQASR